MTQDELNEIKARAMAATPGPWEVDSNTPHICSHVVGNGLDTSCLLHGNRWNDATFIAHARDDVPALVAEVERLRDRISDLELQLEGNNIAPWNEMERLNSLIMKATEIRADDD